MGRAAGGDALNLAGLLNVSGDFLSANSCQSCISALIYLAVALVVLLYTAAAWLSGSAGVGLGMGRAAGGDALNLAGLLNVSGHLPSATYNVITALTVY
jgi:hypothetical protein